MKLKSIKELEEYACKPIYAPEFFEGLRRLSGGSKFDWFHLSSLCRSVRCIYTFNRA